MTNEAREKLEGLLDNLISTTPLKKNTNAFLCVDGAGSRDSPTVNDDGLPESVRSVLVKLESVSGESGEEGDGSPGDDDDISSDEDDGDESCSLKDEDVDQTDERSVIERAQVTSPKPNLTRVRVFDRYIDMSQFICNPNGSLCLYPVLRSWVKHTSGSAKHKASESIFKDEVGGMMEKLTSGGGAAAYVPSDPDMSQNISNGSSSSGKPKMPCDEFPPTKSPKFSLYKPSDKLPAPKELFLENLKHWKKVRQRWQDYSRKEYAPYHRSQDTLRSMYSAVAKK